MRAVIKCYHPILHKALHQGSIIKENAPPGTYQFQVRVSDGVWPDAVSTVTVHVRELRDEAIYNSGSLRLAGETLFSLKLRE